jgi:hypothetical protein
VAEPVEADLEAVGDEGAHALVLDGVALGHEVPRRAEARPALALHHQVETPVADVRLDVVGQDHR